MGLQFASISHNICLIKKPSPYPRDLLDKKTLSIQEKKEIERKRICHFSVLFFVFKFPGEVSMFLL